MINQHNSYVEIIFPILVSNLISNSYISIHFFGRFSSISSHQNQDEGMREEMGRWEELGGREKMKLLHGEEEEESEMKFDLRIKLIVRDEGELKRKWNERRENKEEKTNEKSDSEEEKEHEKMKLLTNKLQMLYKN